MINGRRHHGMAMIWVVISASALLGICSLAVDLGRVVVAKSQLRAAADAAARAGVSALPQGASAAVTAAVATAALNKADGYAVTLNTSTDVQTGYWSGKVFTSGGTPLNAVQITARRTKATNTAIPLLFASILGAPTCDVTATSIAALVAVKTPVTQFVSAQSNIWLAGEPQGTKGSVPDPGYSTAAHPYEYDVAGNPNTPYGDAGGPDSPVAGNYHNGKVESTDYNNEQVYNSILEFPITVTPGSIIQVTNVSGTANNEGEFTGGAGTTSANGSNDGNYSSYANDAAAYYGAGSNPNGYSPPSGFNGPSDVSAGNADSASDAQGAEHGESNVNTPINSIVGVFQNGAPNDSLDTPVPPGLDFSTQAARDYSSMEPELFQTFYVGSGQTSSNVQQTIVVPPNATQLYLGTMDGHEWSNNVGGFNVTITQYQIAIVK
jgi:Flp pilus assembly protein TadG